MITVVQLIPFGENCMSHGPYRFRESEARRLIKAAHSAGIEIARLEADPDGRIVIIPKAAELAEEAATKSEAPNEWDEVT